MNIIRNYIFSENEENPQTRKSLEEKTILQTCASLESSEITIYNLLEQIQVYVLDRKFAQNRKQSYTLLDKIIQKLPPSFLKTEEVKNMTSLFLKSLEADVENAVQVIAFLQTLQTHCETSKNIGYLRIFCEFFGNNKFNTTSYTYEVRSGMYKIILNSLNNFNKNQLDKDWFSQNELVIVQSLIDQTEGEKDPRNLILVLEIWEIVLNTFNPTNLEKSAKSIFEMLSVYFPITFDDENNKVLVNKSYLVESLNFCLSKPALISLFFDLILEKLEDVNKEESNAVLRSMMTLFLQISENEDCQTKFELFAEKLLKKLNFLLFELNDGSIEENTKKVYKEFIILLVNISKKKQTVNWVMELQNKGIIDLFIDEIIKKPNGKNSHSVVDILLETIDQFDAKLLEYTVTLLVLKAHSLINKTPTFIVYVESITPLFVKCFFHELFDSLNIISKEYNLCEVWLAQMFNSQSGSAVRANLLNFYSFFQRAGNKSNIGCSLQTINFSQSERLFWEINKYALSKANVSIFDNENDIFDQFKIVCFNNFSFDKQIIMNLYFKNVISFFSLENVSKSSKIEEFLQISYVFLKKAKQLKFELVSFQNQIKNAYESISKYKNENNKNDNPIMKKIFKSFFDILFIVFSNEANTLFQTFLDQKNKFFDFFFYILQNYKIDFKLLTSLFDQFDFEDYYKCKCLVFLIEKKVILPNEQFIIEIKKNLKLIRQVCLIFRSLMQINFAKHSLEFKQILISFVKNNENLLLEKYINEILREHKKNDNKNKNPLFKQKLSLFLGKFIDSELQEIDKFVVISAKLSLVNFQIKSNISDKKQTENLNTLFSQFILQSKNDLNVHYKYLMFLEHFITNNCDSVENVLDFEVIAHFVSITHQTDDFEKLKLLCFFVEFLTKYLAKCKNHKSNDKSKRIVSFLRKMLSHSKRIVRKLAGCALSNYYITISNGSS